MLINLHIRIELMFVNGYDPRHVTGRRGAAMKYVLFICTHNAGRSQMAQAFFERRAQADVRAESAGSEPAHEVWPTVVEVMREIGIDLAGRRPRKLLLEMQLHADWAVTMGCGDVCPYVPSIVEAWDIPDPAGRPIEEVREIRDMVAEHVHRLIVERLDEIQSDRSAHQWRLRKMLPNLIEEFEGTRTPEEIRACGDAILDRYDDVPVRSHILALANRAARDCLAREHCDALGAA
jgi:arsenate reductase (thioredoxin)